MEKMCPFWPDDRQCLSKECGIGYCDDEVPSGLKQPASISVVRLVPNRTSLKNHSAVTQIGGSGPGCQKEGSNTFDPLDTTLTEGDRRQLSDMDWHDENEDKFCDYEGFFFPEFLKVWFGLKTKRKFKRTKKCRFLCPQIS